MPTHNFMLEDVAGSLRAIALFPLFVVLPGYAIGWWADLFRFRKRTAAFRVVAAIPLSFAICPILTYLAGRFSTTAIWVLYAFFAVAFALALARGRRDGAWGIPRKLWPFAAAVVLWMIVCVGSLVDLQFGHRLFYPVSSIDSSVRSSFVESIATTGIPPQNPFFDDPGRPVQLRYHYFWLMMCSLVERTGAGAITPRQTIIAGTFWSGTGLIGLIALYLRLFCAAGGDVFRRRFGMALVLASVTGLDIIPSAIFTTLHFTGKLKLMLPSVEWWNEHVDWFVYTTLWAPHALASMIACFTAFLLLWENEGRSPRERWLHAAFAGAALASGAGESIYVAFVFAIFLAVWTLVALFKKWFVEVRWLLTAGTASVLLVLPYALDLLHSGGTELPGPGGVASSALPLQFTVRQFILATVISWFTPLKGAARLIFINGPLVPLNYFLELGVFLAAGLLWWRQRRGRPLTRQELACITMIATSVTICTFLKSSVIGCNDLGWRGFLIAEFILLLITAEIFCERRLLPSKDRAMLVLFLALGAAGTIYDLAITRTYPILADAGIVPHQEWMSLDRHYGERTYAARAAYEWVRSATPETATVQFNPKVTFQETTEMLYASRPNLAGDTACNTAFGGDPRDCAPIVTELNALYSPASGDGLRQACAALPMDVVVAKDTDDIWKNRQSWVWRDAPVYANRYVRLFSCGPRASMLSYSKRFSR